MYNIFAETDKKILIEKLNKAEAQGWRVISFTQGYDEELTLTFYVLVHREKV